MGSRARRRRVGRFSEREHRFPARLGLYTLVFRSPEGTGTIDAQTRQGDPLDLSIVGAGRVGTGLAVLLQRAGHRIAAASGRDATGARVERYLPGVPFVADADAARAGDVAILSVPDDRIESLCRELVGAGALLPGQLVVHLSGATSLGALEAARHAGGTVLSLHPLQTVPSVDAAIERLPGCAMAVTAHDEEGFALGERLATDAGGRPFRLPDDRKPLYHAAAVFCSNYLVTVEGLAERLFRAAGLDDPVDLFAPLARATLDHVLEDGPAAALTGPAARGDAGTVRRNLEALEAHAPDTVPAYVALARVAVSLAEESGQLDAEGRARVEEVLEWR
ncbi:MAG TPA: DUF2520 domain-containing protein [Actinomycetota bacterium]|nr:DUF2520 domain-containing protein [Actinomycetota bacterium]